MNGVIVLVHPPDVGLRTLDGLLDLPFGRAEAGLVFRLEPFQLKWINFGITNSGKRRLLCQSQ